MAGLYPARRADDARVVFLFRGESPLDYHHRDVPRAEGAGPDGRVLLRLHVLAGELASAGGNHERAFAAYGRELADIVRRSSAFAKLNTRGVRLHDAMRVEDYPVTVTS